MINNRTKKYNSLLLLLTLVFLCCKTEKTIYETDGNFSLEKIAESEQQWSSIAITSDGRIFTSFPRWEDLSGISLGELSDNKIKYYPNKKINQFKNTYDPENPFFISIQAIYVDSNDFLWVLDAANPLKKGIIFEGPVLYQIDTKTDEIIKKYKFPKSIYTKNSSFSNIIICERDQVAYIADSGEGAIIIFDLRSKKKFRRLINHYSTKAETNLLFVENKKWVQRIHVHSLLLDSSRLFLYYMPVSGYHLYKIPTAALINQDMPEDDLDIFVQRGCHVGSSNDMLYLNQNTILFCNIEENGIGKLVGEEEYSVLFRHKDIAWPSNFARRNKQVYFITSQKHLPPGKRETYKLFRMTF